MDSFSEHYISKAAFSEDISAVFVVDEINKAFDGWQLRELVE
jgi:hypothetical protein